MVTPRRHPFVFLFLLLAILLTACGGSETSAPTPQTQFPTPRLLPTRPPKTPTIAVDEPAAEGVSEPTATAEPEAQLDETTPSGSLPGAYVDIISALLHKTPGGAVLAQMPAGTRVGFWRERAIGCTYNTHLISISLRCSVGCGWATLPSSPIWTRLDELATGDEPPATPSIVSGDTGITASVLPNRLNLRAGPGTNQTVLTSLRSGEEVHLLGRTENNAWLQIRTEAGQEGWAATRYLRTAGDVKTLPVRGVAITGVPAPRPAAPSASPASGRIVFQTRNSGDIYTMNADGSALRRLTRGFDPTLSPDGRQIAFTRWDEPRGLVGDQQRRQRRTPSLHRQPLPLAHLDARRQRHHLRAGRGQHSLHRYALWLSFRGRTAPDVWRTRLYPNALRRNLHLRLSHSHP